MEKMLFAIIGPQTDNSIDLIEAAKKEGYSAELFNIKELKFVNIGNNFVAMLGKKRALDFDVVIFRGYNNNIYEAQLLASMLVKNGKTIIEESLSGCYVRGKMQQANAFNIAGIPHPKTMQAISYDGWVEVLRKMKFPIMAKPVFGRKGRGILKIEGLKEAKEFFREHNNADYLVQEYFPINSDFRVFVVGDKVIGGFKRYFLDGEFKSNVHGTPAEAIEVDEKMQTVALKAAAAASYEIVGVDMFVYRGKIYVIEANVAPQWEKFRAVTGINPAEHIIRYAAEKHLKKI